MKQIIIIKQEKALGLMLEYEQSRETRVPDIGERFQRERERECV